jgi:hypothetical protein
MSALAPETKTIPKTDSKTARQRQKPPNHRLRPAASTAEDLLAGPLWLYCSPGRRRGGKSKTHDIKAGGRALAPSELINILTAVLAVAMVIIVIRIFRGDIGDNRGGQVFALVILGGVLYFLQSDAGLAIVTQAIDSMSAAPLE